MAFRLEAPGLGDLGVHDSLSDAQLAAGRHFQAHASSQSRKQIVWTVQNDSRIDGALDSPGTRAAGPPLPVLYVIRETVGHMGPAR